MRKGSDIIGQPIVAYDTGKKIGRVRDLIFDQDRNYLAALLVAEKGFMSQARILPLTAIRSIGMDAVITGAIEDIIPAKLQPEVATILDRNNIMNGTNIITVSGQDLGRMVDLYFDETTGAIEGYEVSGGIFADAYSGRSFVPAIQALRIGEDYAFVPAMVADLMEEQVGGIKAVAQKAGEQISEASRVATTKVTNAIVDPQAQKSFILGRKTEAAVLRPDGLVFMEIGRLVTTRDIATAEQLGILDRLYRATGGNIADNAKQLVSEIGKDVAEKASSVAQDLSEKASDAAQDLSEKAKSATDYYTVSQALGRRVNKTLRTRNGLIIAAAGQIVTEQTIERAKLHRMEEALLRSVGLSTSSAAKSSLNDTSEQISDTADRVGTKVQNGLSESIQWVKHTSNKLRTQTNQALEEKQIHGALGRPATRVILDRQDRVILNAGELITHKAIEAARAAGVLDVILSSVYTKTPEFSEATLLASERGRAALPAST